MRCDVRHAAISGAILCALAATPASASVSAASGASGEILQEIQFAVLLDMNFGRIAVRDNTVGGSVTIDPASGARNCDPSLVCTGTFAVSRLDLTGSDANVQVNFAPTFQLTGPGAPINATPMFPGGPGAVVRLSGGHTEVNFGARIDINPGQAPGIYNGTFAVNLEYN